MLCELFFTFTLIPMRKLPRQGDTSKGECLASS